MFLCHIQCSQLCRRNLYTAPRHTLLCAEHHTNLSRNTNHPSAPILGYQPSQCPHPKHTNHRSALPRRTNPDPDGTKLTQSHGTRRHKAHAARPGAGPSRTQQSSAAPAPGHGAPPGPPGSGRFPHRSVTHPGAAEPPSADGSTWGSGRGRGLRPFRPSVRPAQPRGAGSCCHLAVRGSETLPQLHGVQGQRRNPSGAADGSGPHVGAVIRASEPGEGLCQLRLRGWAGKTFPGRVDPEECGQLRDPRVCTVPKGRRPSAACSPRAWRDLLWLGWRRSARALLGSAAQGVAVTPGWPLPPLLPPPLSPSGAALASHTAGTTNLPQPGCSSPPLIHPTRCQGE